MSLSTIATVRRGTLLVLSKLYVAQIFQMLYLEDLFHFTFGFFM